MITVENLVAELQEQQVELIVGGLKDTSTGSWSISGPGISISDYF